MVVDEVQETENSKNEPSLEVNESQATDAPEDPANPIEQEHEAVDLHNSEEVLEESLPIVSKNSEVDNNEETANVIEKVEVSTDSDSETYYDMAGKGQCNVCYLLIEDIVKMCP